MDEIDISLLVLTYNEEDTIADCLRSAPWVSERVVFDSGSEDQTREIAEDLGAKVVVHPFEDYATQRNAALEKVEYSNRWVLMLDADERATPELRREIAARVVGTESVDLYRIRRRDIIFGQWLRHATGYPSWFARVVRPGRVRVERPVNERYRPQSGETGRLESHLLHYPMAAGLESWIRRHNEYSTMEAQIRANEDAAGEGDFIRMLQGGDVARTKILKDLSYKLPLRPTAVFLYFLIWRLGILDGRPGVQYCKLRYWYEYMIELKTRQCQREDNTEDNW